MALVAVAIKLIKKKKKMDCRRRSKNFTDSEVNLLVETCEQK
jgi:hypothetical protein